MLGVGRSFAAPVRALDARARAAVHGRKGDTITVAVPAVLASAFVVLLIANFGSIVRAIYDDSDIASLPVIGALLPFAPHHAEVVTGFGGWYTGLWFELGTRFLPFHWQLWEVGPWLVSLTAIGLVVWSTVRVAGRWAGAFVAFVLVCAGPALLVLQFGWAKHGAATAQVCVLGWYLVLLVQRDGIVGRRATHVLLAVIVAVSTAAGAASDLLLYAAGLVPFVIAGFTVALLVPRRIGLRIAATAAGVAALSVVVSRIVVAAMKAQHIHPMYFPIRFVTWDRIVPNAEAAAQSLAGLFNADFGGEKPGARSLLAFGCALAVTAGVVVAVRLGRNWFSEVARRTATSERDDSRAFALRAALTTFWLFVCIATTAVFVFSSVAAGSASRYLIPVAYGLTVLVSLAAAGHGGLYRRAAVFGASLIVTGSVVGLAAGDLTQNPDNRRFAKVLLTFAQGEGLTYGYAHYWDAARFTALLHGRLQIYPIEPCDSPHGLCKAQYNTISTWYEPRAGSRSFVIVDHRYGLDPGATLGGTVDALSWKGLTILVYDYDIASNLGPARPWNGQ